MKYLVLSLNRMMKRMAMLILTATVALVALVAGSRASANAIESSPSECSPYREISNELHCSKNGYLLRFGENYCLKFVRANDQFSDEGQATLAGIRACLIGQLRARPDLSCRNVKRIAVASHLPCYIENHFCDMNWLEQAKLAEIIAPALSDPTLRDAVLKIGAACLTEGPMDTMSASASPPTALDIWQAAIARQSESSTPRRSAPSQSVIRPRE